MKLKQTILCLALCLCMLVSCLPIAAAADDEIPQGLWTDFAAAGFSGGAGTKEDPYLISTPEQLARLAKDVNSGVPSKIHEGEYFKLTADIDLSGHIWTPLGYESYGTGSSQSFMGHFDGDGHKVTGLYVDERGRNRSAGLFGCVAAVDEEPMIQNLTVENGTVYAGDGTDDSATYAAGLLIGNITILGSIGVSGTSVKNCTVSGTVTSNMYAGGLVGGANYTTISDCHSDASVNGYVGSGGLVGYAFSSELVNCVATGDVTSKGWCTGGLVGLMYSTVAEKCAAFGDVKADDWQIGGFVGYALDSTKIRNCAAFGDVTSSVEKWEPKAGGFAGEITDETSIEKSHAAGKVSAANPGTTTGGMVGTIDDGGNSVTACSFDGEKNAELKAVCGEGIGTYEIEKAESAKVISNICNDYYGGHDFEEVPQVDPTCTDFGSKAGSSCKRCGQTTGFGVIDPLGHEFGEWTSDGNGKHVRLCKHDNTHTETEDCADTDHDHMCDTCGGVFSEHEGGTATCVEKAICTICNEPYGETDANNHTDLEHIEAIKATKEAEGNIEYWYCTGCHKYYSDPDAVSEISREDTVIEKLPEDPVPPQTGDNRMIWIILLIVSGGAAVAAIVVGKKKHSDN